MAYFIFPATGTVSHIIALQARVDTGTMPSNLYIMWRKNGAPVLVGSTGDSSKLAINTGLPADPTNFTAADTGSVIDFLIYDADPSGPATLLSTALPIVLSNTSPVVSGAIISDVYGRTPVRPTVVWTYSDADGDPQFQYQIKFGTTAGASDLHDSTILYGAATTYTIPNTSSAIPSGTVFYWTIEVSDGEKVNPFDVSPTATRVVVTASGTAVANTKPVITNVLADGIAAGIISSLTPLISWTYNDVDGQPQVNFRVLVCRDVGFADVLWDSGTILGTATSVRYNFQHQTASNIEHHKTLYIGVLSSDGLELSAPGTTTMFVAGRPVITTVSVDGRVNPLNVSQQQPRFNWKYTDLDSDPLVSYEIRVADNDADLGTDSFIGNIWAPGVVTSPEAYATRLNFDGTAFGGELSCIFPKALLPNVRYYFQVMIYDGYGGISDWATGYFQLNSPPRAINLYIVPTAPWNSDDLNCAYTFVDDVGDRESTLTQIKWYQQSSSATSYTEVTSLRNQRTVPSDLTIPGDLWKFSVRPHDGFEYSTTTYESAPVTIHNRPPVATALAITPSQPKTSDNLKAVFAVSDPDNDPVQVSITWYRNGEEQPDLKNALIIPASVTSLDDVWYFTILPTDGYDSGPLATSPTVTILNTPPQITSIQVEGDTFPKAVADSNPTISWTYDDPDLQPQMKYQVIIGTKPARTKKILTNITRDLPAGSALAGLALGCGGQNGVISIAKGDGELVAGNDIFDSGVVTSDAQMFQYLTADSKKDVALSAVDFENLTDYMLMSDLQTIALQIGKTSGTASAKFTGLTSLYDVNLTYVKESGKSSLYKLLVDGTVVDQFTSSPGTGRDTYVFNSVRLEQNSTLTITGIADSGSKASFYQVKCVAKGQVEVNAADFDTLSGYLKDGTGGVKVAGLAGTATDAFTLPSGIYDIELVYVTESSGNPIVSLMVGNTTILSFTYESGPLTRSKFVKGVQITNGAAIKISGTRSGGALARVKKIIYRPVETTKVGANLKAGLVYYGSIRVYDGRDWSDWYTTTWRMKGSAWASVSNRTGWTIETTLAIVPGSDLQQKVLDSIGQQAQSTTTAPLGGSGLSL